MSILEVSGLHTQFDTERGTINAVHDVDLTVDKGQIVGIVGESGSGKSVLAQSIMKLIDPPGKIVDGEVHIDGESVLDKSEQEMQSIRGGKVSFVFQDPMNSLNPVLTVGEQISESVRLHQNVDESVSLSAEIKRKILGATKNSESWRQAINMLEQVKIAEPESRVSNYPHQLSGGMRQRAMIALALASKPDLLIADEPTTALDVTTQAELIEHFVNLKNEFDTSILFITHDLGVVAEVCDEVNVMYTGQIVERGTCDELFENPQHPYTQGLLASTPKGDIGEDRLTPIPGQVPEPNGDPIACTFAPRCPESKPECYNHNPDYRQVGSSGHDVACLRRGPEDKQI